MKVLLACLVASTSCGGLILYESLKYSVAYLDKTGKIVIELNSNVVTSGDFHEGLAKIMIGEKWGYINKGGKQVIPPEFDNASDFSEKLARIGMGDAYLGKSKYIDQTGKVVVEPHLYDISYFSDFHEGLTAVQNIDREKGYLQPLEKRKNGYIDSTGKVVIKGNFDTNNPENRFSEGVAAVYLINSSKTRYINKTGKNIFEGQLIGSKFSEGLARITISDKQGYIDKTGRIVIQPQFAYTSDFHEELARIGIGTHQEGYINKTGKIVVQPKFSHVREFSEGLAAVETRDGKWGYLDKTGKYAIAPQFYRAGNFSEGLARVATSLDLCSKNGYIDKMGKYVINPDFYGASDFSEGLAQVGLGSYLACIYHTGKGLSQIQW